MNRVFVFITTLLLLFSISISSVNGSSEWVHILVYEAPDCATLGMAQSYVLGLCLPHTTGYVIYTEASYNTLNITYYSDDQCTTGATRSTIPTDTCVLTGAKYTYSNGPVLPSSNTVYWEKYNGTTCSKVYNNIRVSQSSNKCFIYQSEYYDAFIQDVSSAILGISPITCRASFTAYYLSACLDESANNPSHFVNSFSPAPVTHSFAQAYQYGSNTMYADVKLGWPGLLLKVQVDWKDTNGTYNPGCLINTTNNTSCYFIVPNGITTTLRGTILGVSYWDTVTPFYSSPIQTLQPSVSLIESKFALPLQEYGDPVCTPVLYALISGVFSATPNVTKITSTISTTQPTVVNSVKCLITLSLSIPTSPNVQSLTASFNVKDSTGVTTQITIIFNTTCLPMPNSLSYIATVPAPSYPVYLSNDFSFVLQPRINRMPVTLSCVPTNPHFTAAITSDTMVFMSTYVISLNYNLTEMPGLPDISSPFQVNFTITFNTKTYNLVFNISSLFPQFDNIPINNNVNIKQYPGKSIYPQIATGYVYTELVKLNIQPPVNNALVGAYPNEIAAFKPVLGDANSMDYIYQYTVPKSSNPTLNTSQYFISNIVTPIANSNILYNSTIVNNNAPGSSFIVLNDTYFSQLVDITLFPYTYYDGMKISELLTSPKTLLPGYPFGFKKNNSISYYTYQFALLGQANVPTLTTTLNIYNTNNIQKTLMLDPTSVESKSPVISNVKFTKVSPVSYLATITASDEGSGLKQITICSTGSYCQIFTSLSQYIVSGTIWDGVFEFQVSNIFINQLTNIQIYDYCNNFNTYSDLYNQNDLSFVPLQPYLHLLNLYINDFTFFQFIPNQIDTSFGPTNVTLLFNLTRNLIDVNYQPSLQLYQSNGKTEFIPSFAKNYLIKWDYTDRVYRVDFQIPAKMINSTISYSLDYAPLLSSADFIEKFGNGAQLSVISSYGDEMPPMVVDIKYLSPPINIIPGQSVTNGFSITIADQVNGLDSGYISIISNRDPLPRIYQFNQSTRTSGDIYNGVYKIQTEAFSAPCLTQVFTIQELSLTDKSGHRSQYRSERTHFTGLVNPLSMVLDNSTMNLDFTIVCPNIAVLDSEPPYIVDIQASRDYVNINSDSRDINITLIVRDDGIGLSPRHDPHIYLSEFQYTNIIDIPHTSKTVQSANQTKYDYRFTIPYGYGGGFGNGIGLAVYGIVDKLFNINGYSTVALKNNSKLYTIQTTYSYSIPFIDSTSEVYKHGGALTMWGKYFIGGSGENATASVDYMNGNGFVNVPVVDCQGSVLVATIGQVNSKQIKVKVSTPVDSNIVTINRSDYFVTILYPSIPSQTCPTNQSNLICSGNGKCTSDGCSCYTPFYGSDCTSTTDSTTPPLINSTTPVVVIGNNTNNNGTNTAISSSISIHLVRELDIYGNTVIEYKSLNWTSFNYTDSSKLEYVFSTQLFNSKLNTFTQLNTTIQWSSLPMIIPYAYSNITVPPFTVKYSIASGSYRFSNPLNILQIVLGLEVAPSDESANKCTTQEYGGSDEDLQWIKLKIQEKSFYGQFIRKGVIDSRVVSIRNSRVKDIQVDNGYKSFIGVNVPFFRFGALVDPYFSQLLESNSNLDECQGGNASSSKLTVPQIVGIVVGAVVFVTFAGLVGYLILGKKYRIQLAKKSIKLVKLNN